MSRLRHALFTTAVLAKEALLYVRQSTPEQVRDNIGSTALQREQRNLARAFGFADDRIHEVDDDLGRSGSSTKLRSGLADMKRRIMSGTVGAIFAVNAGRVARFMKDTEDVRLLARDHGVVVVINGRPVDPADPTDVVLLQMQASFAEYENRTRTEGMRRARLAKARGGAVVSQLPIGWIRLADGTWDFDPEVRPAIEDVYATFGQVRTLRGTVTALNRAKRPLPTRYRGRLEWKRATVDAVRRILTNRAYAGWYEFGKTESRLELGVQANGHAVRGRVPETRWIRRPHHHPAYVTDEGQRQIQEQLNRNEFRTRSRPGAGYALLQGVIRCGVCGGLLAPVYPRPNHGAHRYQCNVQSSKYGVRPCLSVQGRDLDAAMERTVLAVLRTPSVETLTRALTLAKAADAAQRDRVVLEGERLAAAERLAQEAYEVCDPRNQRVRLFAEGRLEQAIVARQAFEEQQAAPAPAPVDGTEDELRELCALAADLPRLWGDHGVSDRERKEVLRAVVHHVVVSVTSERVDIEIHWQSGAKGSLYVWRRAGMHGLVRRLHADGLTVAAIQEWLAAGDPETGQSWRISRTAISQQLRRAGLTPRHVAEGVRAARARVRALYEAGMTLTAIAATMNAAGSTMVQGRAWNGNAVYRALDHPDRRDRLERLQRIALRRLKQRGLSNRRAAEELNRAGVPRVGNRPWTAEHVRQRRTQLKRLGCARRARVDHAHGKRDRWGRGGE